MAGGCGACAVGFACRLENVGGCGLGHMSIKTVRFDTNWKDTIVAHCIARNPESGKLSWTRKSRRKRVGETTSWVRSGLRIPNADRPRLGILGIANCKFSVYRLSDDLTPAKMEGLRDVF